LWGNCGFPDEFSSVDSIFLPQAAISGFEEDHSSSYKAIKTCTFKFLFQFWVNLSKEEISARDLFRGLLGDGRRETTSREWVGSLT
jgi:hypothetical protein